MTIDKYTKILLTVIAVGVIGINFHFYGGNFVKEAKAELYPIDIMIMRDEVIQRIALAEIRLQYLIEGTHGIDSLNKN